MAPADRQSPPGPRLVVRVGALGHRPNRLAADQVSRIETQCRLAIAAIRDGAALARDPRVHAPDPPLLRIVSALAEGADRIVAAAGLALGCDLECPLPFAVADYEQDFADAESRAAFHALIARAAAVLELDGAREDEARAYEAVGRTIIGHCDIVIAVWDGAAAAGRGGTAQIVAEAVARQIPVIWIDAGTAVEPRLLLGNVGSRREEPFSRLTPWLGARLGIAPGEAGPAEQEARRYIAERRPHFDAGQAFKLFRDLVAYRRWRGIEWHVPDYEGAARAQWEAELARIPDLPEPTRRQILDRLCPHFAWADGLSDHYAGLYRSSYIATNLFGALAVLFGLGGLFDRLVRQQPDGMLGAFIETLLIAAILGMTYLGRRRQWHVRWLDYRQLAEWLRQLRYLVPLACATPAPLAAARLGGEPRLWLDGFFRAVVREMGLAAGRADRGYRGAMTAWLDEVIGDQIAYHARTAATMARLDRHLHNVGRGLFWATFGCCVLRILWPDGSDVLLIGAAGFPALGAAFYAIRSHGEFARIADRSENTGRDLARLRAEIEASIRQGPASLAELQSRAVTAADIMVGETVGWRDVVRYRPLVLPV